MTQIVLVIGENDLCYALQGSQMKTQKMKGLRNSMEQCDNNFSGKTSIHPFKK